jgi:hypothetical protein
VVHADRELLDAECHEQIIDYQHHLDVGRDLRHADRIEIALHELAIPSGLRVLAAPHRGNVVPLERQPQLLRMLGDEPRQRHGEIEPQAHVAAAVILKAVELLVGFLAPFAGEDLEVLKRRRVDRPESIGAIDPPRRLDDPLPRHHRLGKIIAKTF